MMVYRLSKFILLSSLLLLFTLSCVRKTPIPYTRSTALRVVDTPMFEDDLNKDSLIEAIDQSLRAYSKIAANKKFIYGPLEVSTQDLIKSLNDFKDALNMYGLTEGLYNYIDKYYYTLSPSEKKTLFTGYFEASLRGSRKKSAKYYYPLYKRPDNLITINLTEFPILSKFTGLPVTIRGRFNASKKIIPYYTRNEIDYTGILKGQELIWVDDHIDAFFLHIQGSGIVTLENGEKVRVNYADKNGQPYKSIGKLLLEKGILTRKNVSMQAIKNYLRNNPDKIKEVFNYNPSYVFFREVKEGPIGSLGVPLTAHRSIATDKSLFPSGSLVYIRTAKPVFTKDGQLLRWENFGRFVLNQDTGGAIKGVKRVDLFTGYGKESALFAGHMKQSGEFYFLLRK